MFPINLTDAVFIAKVIDFVFFAATIAYVYLRWGQPMLVAHQETQNKQVEDAQAQRAAAADLVVARQQELEQTKRDGSRMVEVALQQAQHLVRSQKTAAQEHAQRVIVNAGGELDRERYRARHELLLDTVERAYRRATELARQEIDAAAQARLVERLMSEIEASARA